MRTISQSFVYSSTGDASSEIDYTIVVKDKKGVIIGKGGTSVILLDISLLTNSMFVLNYKELSTTGEAYGEYLKWIGKMIKEPSDSGYFNQKNLYQWTTEESCINASNLAEAIKNTIDRDLESKKFEYIMSRD